MSSTLFSNASPFATALPASHMFFHYDADGDCIMTDAVTGLPITYGASVSGYKRSRSASMDDDSTDSRPSKRSRMSSDDEDGEQVNTTISSISAATPSPVAALCPPAPKKAPRAFVGPSDDDEDYSSLRNLAESMAEAVLAGEPRERSPVGPVAYVVSDGTDPHVGNVVLTASEYASYNAANIPLPASPASVQDEGGFCISLTCSDLALRLDMRHPRVVLNFLRFIKSYNDLAPQGEDIHLPPIGQPAADEILSHPDVANPNEASLKDAEDLKQLLNEFRCNCYDCEPYEDSETEYTDDDYDRYSRDSF